MFLRKRVSCSRSFDEKNLIYRFKDNEKGIVKGSEDDILKILEIPYYNRYADKTQVHSLVENDDITRRSLHVQLVSFIARTMGRALGLNMPLIEAIALSHDIGHTPFGHVGERYLDRILYSRTGVHFYHNIQGVRVLDDIFCANVSYQVLSGVLCHCGKFFSDDCKIELKDSQFSLKCADGKIAFELLYDKINTAKSSDKGYMKDFVADTLEGIVVRVSDVIAYVAKDRSDSLKIGYGNKFDSDIENYNIVRDMINDIVQCSKGKDFIAMSPENCKRLKSIREENFNKIYIHSDYNGLGGSMIFPLFTKLYSHLYDDLESRNTTSIIYKHHLNYIARFKNTPCFDVNIERYLGDYSPEQLNAIVCDFLSSMSDDYFVALCKEYYPDFANKLLRQGYFDHNNYLTKV